ncbi:MAG: nucleoside kinase [Clostridia bacterium]|nr:nucleoside kinase [Clostridia bacterium]
MFIELETLNKNITENAKEFIERSDKQYTDSIQKVVCSIIAQKDTSPIVLISGPSGSGKTTTAHTLERMLESAGLATHTLSIDDFFYPMTEKEKELHKQNKLNLEGPGRVDCELLNRTLRDIINCKTVYLPCFDFVTNSRSMKTEPLKRREGEIVVVEGTHALNPDVITLPDSQTVRIYVSVRTRVKTEEGHLIHPEYIRLMRRMLRDNLYRGRSFSDTAKMYHKVQDGENKYIMPYKYRSSFDIDTFIPYELSIYRDLIFDGLVKEDMYHKVPELIELVDGALPLSKDLITNKNALITEFLGK